MDTSSMEAFGKSWDNCRDDNKKARIRQKANLHPAIEHLLWSRIAEPEHRQLLAAARGLKQSNRL